MRVSSVRRWVACSVALGLAVAAPPAAAERYSAYEKVVIASALKGRGETLDPEPQGKTIETIRFVLIDVFDELDPVPDWVNAVHTRSRRRVIARELLFARGQRYDQARIDETARNLRQLFQLSLVLLVPLRGSAPDRVRVLVITKDVWSLRFGWDPQIQRPALTGTDPRSLRSHLQLMLLPLGALEVMRLDASFSEVNLAGLHQTAAVRFGLDPASYYFGAAYENLRVAGSRIRAYGSGNVIFNRDTGKVEGSFGGFSYGQPLWSLATRWSYHGLMAWRTDIERDFVGTRIQTYDARATAGNDAIPRVWDRDLVFGQYALTRSVGADDKLDWTAGAEVSRAVFDAGDLSPYPAPAMAEYKRVVVPVSDQRTSPFLALRARTSRFLRTLNLETLALQEDVSLGHDLTVKLYPASSAVASTRDLFGIEASAGYTVPLGDGIGRVVVVSITELTGDAGTDAVLRGYLHLATPSLGFGRLVFGGLVTDRYRDYLRSRFSLGGSTRLRGFFADEFKGKDVVAGNIEYRSPPVDVLSVQVGAALFYDVGDAFDGFANLCPKQAVGFGGRFVFPQLNRAVFRVDWGFPVDANRACDLAHGRSVLALPRDPWQGLFLGFEQAFGLPRTVRPTLPESLSR